MVPTELCVAGVMREPGRCSKGHCSRLLGDLREDEQSTLSQSSHGALRAPFAPSQDISQGSDDNLNILCD